LKEFLNGTQAVVVTRRCARDSGGHRCEALWRRAQGAGGDPERQREKLEREAQARGERGREPPFFLPITPRLFLLSLPTP